MYLHLEHVGRAVGSGVAQEGQRDKGDVEYLRESESVWRSRQSMARVTSRQDGRPYLSSLVVWLYQDSTMTSNFDFTEKTEHTLQAAIQLAKDYANSQGFLSSEMPQQS